MPIVGVLGTGRMGAPIARGLLAAGHEVLAWDPVPERLAGLPSAAGAAQVAASVDVLITVLPGVPEFEALAADGTLDALRQGALLLDLTSNDPRVIERVAAALAERRVDTVAAPMGGGIAAAEAGTLSFFVGGPTSAVDLARPLLAALGTIDHIGEAVGSGCSAKLLANLLWFGQAVAVTEALLLGQSLGLPPASLRATLAASAGGSVFLDEYVGRLLDGDDAATFGIDRCVEELETLASLARDGSVPFELSTLVGRLHREALERFGAVDGELLAARLLEERAGRPLRR